MEKWRYSPNPPDSNEKIIPLRVAVAEFDDRNQYRNFDNSMGAYFTLAYVPLIPYMAQTDHYYPTKFGKCLDAELRSSNMFTRVVYYQDWEVLAENYKYYDLIITGKLIEDKVHSDVSFYGLGFVGFLLSLTQLPPYHFITRNVDFEIKAFRPNTPDKSIHIEKVHFDDSAYPALAAGRDSSDVGRRMLLATGFGEDQKTDFCTSKQLQPKFLRFRNNLKTAIAAGFVFR